MAHRRKSKRNNRVKTGAQKPAPKAETGQPFRLRDFLKTLGPGLITGASDDDPSGIGTRTPTFSLRIEGHPPRVIAERLDEEGIFVWDGNYYALAVMQRLGLEESGGAIRVGFCHYHSNEDVERVVAALAAGGSA